MIKNILYQQQEECAGLLKHAYIERIDVSVKAEYFLSSDARRKQEISDLQVIDFLYFRFYFFDFYRTNDCFSPCFLSEKFAPLPAPLPYRSELLTWT